MKKNLIVLFFLVISFFGYGQNITPSKSIAENFEIWIDTPEGEKESLENYDFSKKALTKSEADDCTNILLYMKQNEMIINYGQQWNNRLLNYNNQSMPFFYQIFGNKPSDGRSLFISLHGGGGTAPSVNDQQYQNQQHLYDQTMSSLEGVYLAVRAPTNSWDLWHQSNIDHFLNIIIQMAVIAENVNPNKIYILGYSAGGDGVYQLAPRMADRWASASMMAGHPNETSPLGLKNLPFAIHVGALDNGYDRNLKAQEWKIMLDSLEKDAPGTYIHQVQLHEGLTHWMNLEDAVALPWMINFKRNPIPKKIIWKQDDRHHNSFYWLAVPNNEIKTGGEIIAEYNSQTNEINIISNYSKVINIYVNDKMLNLDKTITIKYKGKIISQKTFERNIFNISKTMSAKGDAELSFPCIITVINNATVLN